MLHIQIQMTIKQASPFNPFGPNMTAFTSPEDLMKNLPKAMANMGKAMGGGAGLLGGTL
jgi:hypothetical protein